MITIPHRQTFFFTNMGSARWTRPGAPATQGIYLCSNTILVNMTDPYQIIADLYHDPSAIAHSADANTTNSTRTLASELDPFFTTHERMCVVASSVQFNATQIPNQAGLDNFNNQAGTGSMPAGTSTTANNFAGDGTPGSGNHPPYMANVEPTLNGNVYAAMIKHRVQGKEYVKDDTIPIAATNASLHALKTDVPGIRMKNVICTPRSSKNIKMVTTYTPSHGYGSGSWRNNESLLTFTNPQVPSGRPNGAPERNMLACFGLFNEFSPGTEGQSTCPLFKVEIAVNYKIRMIRRRQTFAGNAALAIPTHTPHVGEL